jgi:hypothetical protein
VIGGYVGGVASGFIEAKQNSDEPSSLRVASARGRESAIQASIVGVLPALLEASIATQILAAKGSMLTSASAIAPAPITVCSNIVTGFYVPKDGIFIRNNLDASRLSKEQQNQSKKHKNDGLK